MPLITVSMGLKRLTIQLMFNEVSLFTFSNGTHGFAVMVTKNYLKIGVILLVIGAVRKNTLLQMITKLCFHNIKIYCQ